MKKIIDIPVYNKVWKAIRSYGEDGCTAYEAARICKMNVHAARAKIDGLRREGWVQISGSTKDPQRIGSGTLESVALYFSIDKEGTDNG